MQHAWNGECYDTAMKITTWAVGERSKECKSHNNQSRRVVYVMFLQSDIIEKNKIILNNTWVFYFHTFIYFGIINYWQFS